MIQFFKKKYIDIVKYIINQLPFATEQIIKMLRPEERKEAWKGIILSEILSRDQIKKFVKNIL